MYPLLKVLQLLPILPFPHQHPTASLIPVSKECRIPLDQELLLFSVSALSFPCHCFWLLTLPTKKDESVATEARALFAQLEAGNAQLKTQWSEIRNATVDSLKNVYSLLIHTQDWFTYTLSLYLFILKIDLKIILSILWNYHQCMDCGSWGVKTIILKKIIDDGIK